MNPARGVTDKGDPLGTEILGEFQPQRIGPARTLRAQLAEKVAETVLEFLLENIRIRRLQRVCDIRRLGPDKR